MMPLSLLAACGDLEPDMQDTRTVSLNMDFYGKTSSRNSSSVSASELSQYNTHLILALPSWEYLTSNYRNYFSSFAHGLMNEADKKVSLEIPLNRQMKIFAFLFKENYSLPDLISGLKEVGYYGESQFFSIDKQTNNLSLGISLIQVPGTDTDNDGEDLDTGGSTDNVIDTTAPTAYVSAATITSSENATVQSTEIGTAYLVNTTVSVSNLASITGAEDNMSNSVTISLANTDTDLQATGLVDGTYKGYAVDAAGNLSGASADNVTISSSGVIDIDGNVYSTVVIGTQHWMDENLKVTKYRNGDNITNITGNSGWASDTSGAYGVYADDASNLDSYGLLYNWYAVDNSSSRYICPAGWHVPTRDEYSALSTYLGGNSVAGGKMKETGIEHWTSPNTGATNSSGFSARGSGYKQYINGSYSQEKLNFYSWSSTELNNTSYFSALSSSNTTFSFSNTYKNYGFSVRCLED